jgi:hypothetical protein
MAEDKAIATMQTIFARVQREFPLVAAVGNLAKRLAKDLRDKVADVYHTTYSVPPRDVLKKEAQGSGPSWRALRQRRMR